MAACAFAGTPAAGGQGNPDQVNDPPTGTSYGCGRAGSPLFQGFIPSRRQLSAVELRLRAGGAIAAGGVSFPVRIRRGSPTGDVLGQALATVPAPDPLGVTWLGHVDFAQPLVLEPEGTFVIEGPSLPDSIVTWMGTEFGTSPSYPGGMAFSCGGSPNPPLDLNFVTFMPADGSAPETSISQGPDEGSLNQERAASVVFAGADDLSYASKLRFTCSLDGSPGTACTSPYTASGLSDGGHVFTVQARDEAGKADASPATLSWKVDATPPHQPRVRGPHRTRNARPLFVFTASDTIDPASTLRFRCSLDSRRLRACGRSVRPLLRDGAHLLRVAALDRAGNRSAVIVFRVVRLSDKR
jgi:hypothetical protein